MRGPQPQVIALTAEERTQLEALVRRHGTGQQLVLRARIILAAAAGQNNSQLARHLGVEVATARLWRGRWLGLRVVPLSELSVGERLADAPRAGGPCRITAEQVCRLTALACEAPAASARPLSQWRGREIAAEVIKRGIVTAISPRHAARLRTRGIASRTAAATG